jgi:hypothetical protein
MRALTKVCHSIDCYSDTERNVGHCLITLGTGTETDFSELAFSLGLLPFHCYALIGASGSNPSRLMS